MQTFSEPNWRREPGVKSKFTPRPSKAEFSAAQEAEIKREKAAVTFGRVRHAYKDLDIEFPFDTFDEWLAA